MIPERQGNQKKEGLARRRFLRFLCSSPVLGAASGSVLGWHTAKILQGQEMDAVTGATSKEVAENIFYFKKIAAQKLDPGAMAFINGGSDDELTLRANTEAFHEIQIRSRRLVDVSQVDTLVEIFGMRLPSPIFLAPVGAMALLHPDGEPAVARAARGALMVASTVSSFPISEIAAAGECPLWFQLYPTRDRAVTVELLRRAESAGCPVTALSVDSPVVGNRESQSGFFEAYARVDPALKRGNFRGISNPGQVVQDPALTWDFISWLKSNTSMKIVLKGIVTREDARLCLEHGVEGVIVSNHGGRQEESIRSSIECLPEVVEAVEGRIPVLFDGGVRRGTHVFKALALGARAVGIGRPYLWGLAAYGSNGVESTLHLLHSELVRIMQLAGAASISKITPEFVKIMNPRW